MIGFPGGWVVRIRLPVQETQVWSLGQEDPLEREMATHFSILAWRIPMDRGAWRATVPGVTKSWTRLNTHAQHTDLIPNHWTCDLCLCLTPPFMQWLCHDFEPARVLYDHRSLPIMIASNPRVHRTLHISETLFPLLFGSSLSWQPFSSTSSCLQKPVPVSREF